MKRDLIFCLFIAVLAVFLPFAAKAAPDLLHEPGFKASSLHSKIPEVQKFEPAAVPTANSAFFGDLTISVLNGSESVTMALEDYLVGVVAGEMPVSFEPEALKAQAVAARTYTLYKLVVSPSVNHEENVCTDPACCKAYSNEAALREKWGDDYDENIAKITDAVNKTRGEYIVYDSLPILAVFHSSSYESTESSENVWSAALPYLSSVASPESADDVSDFITSVNISFDDFKETVLSQYPNADFSGEPGSWLMGAEYTQSGRLSNIRIGGVSIRGTELRSLFSLRSAAIKYRINDNDIEFTVSGYGHGVGMSQYGANAMAKTGSDYHEILSWYYTDVAFENLYESEMM